MDRQYQPYEKLNAPVVCPFCGQKTFKVFVQMAEWRCYTCAAHGSIHKFPGGEYPVFDDMDIPLKDHEPIYG
jgi:ribosomal protein L37AE/L43A